MNLADRMLKNLEENAGNEAGRRYLQTLGLMLVAQADRLDEEKEKRVTLHMLEHCYKETFRNSLKTEDEGTRKVYELWAAAIAGILIVMFEPGAGYLDGLKTRAKEEMTEGD